MGLLKDKKTIDQTETYIYDTMLNYGWSPAQASGIVGNLKTESGYKTNAIGNIGYKGGNSEGIAQWRTDRLKKLKSRHGDNWKTLDAQLEHINWELNNTHKKAGDNLRNSKTPYEAGKVFTNQFEIPQKKYDQAPDRRENVDSIYKKYVDGNYEVGTGFKDKSVNNQPYESNITPIKTNFDTNYQGITFTEPEPKEQDTKVVEATRILTQKQNEENFLNEIFSQQESQIAQMYAPTEDNQQLQIKSLDESFSEISNFIDSPLASEGGIVKDNNGYLNPNNWGKTVLISSPSITMGGVRQTLIGESKETGEVKLMFPEKNYFFKNTQNVIETQYGK